MPAFELLRPASIDAALDLLDRHNDASVLPSGLDTFDALLDLIKRPAVLVDVGNINELKGIEETLDGVEIGAATPLADVAEHPIIRQQFRLLADAAEAVASPQSRNQGTIGGNLCQSTRCCYYRRGWPCFRSGGNTCYADTPIGMNREHAIFDVERCAAVNPSDTAPALIALDAQMVIRSPRGERVVNAEEYFIGPATDISRTTVLGRNELLTDIRIPRTWANAQFYFEKVRDRFAWDFALVNVAAAMRITNGVITDARLAVNAVAGRPKRLHAVEASLRGSRRDETTARLAGTLAVEGARPLQFNGYKVPLLRNLVTRAVRGGDQAWTS